MIEPRWLHSRSDTTLEVAMMVCFWFGGFFTGFGVAMGIWK